MEKSIHTQEYAVFARRLREARLTAGVKQIELAARIGKTHSYVSRIETREIRVDIIELRQICAALQIPFKQFIDSLEDELKDMATNDEL